MGVVRVCLGCSKISCCFPLQHCFLDRRPELPAERDRERARETAHCQEGFYNVDEV